MKYSIMVALSAISLLLSIGANAALVQVNFTGVLEQTSNTLAGYSSLDGASYSATFIADDMDYNQSTVFDDIQTTHIKIISAKLELSGSNFDGTYFGTGSSSCCGGTMRAITWSISNPIGFDDEVTSYQSTQISGVTFDFGGNIRFIDDLFTFGVANSPAQYEGVVAAGSSFRLETDNGERYWLAGGIVNPAYQEASFQDYSTAYSISTVPVPAAAWLFGSGLLGLIGVARRNKAT